jgi:hypothetical protein
LNGIDFTESVYSWKGGEEVKEEESIKNMVGN